MKKILFIMGLLATGPALAADDLNTLQALGQAQFRLLSEDLGAALSYKAVAPVEPLGITGFDVGLEVTATGIKNTAAMDAATSGSGLSTLPLPKVHLHKGLPVNIDVGLLYASVPNSNIALTGFEVRYAFIEGGAATPAVAVRGTYSVLSGVDQLDLSTMGLELGVSKGFAMFTPYAGIGRVWVTSTPKAEAVTLANLSEETFSLSKYVLGVNLNLGLLNLALETDTTGEASTTSFKLGLRF